MKDSPREGKRKPYRKPAVIFSKRIEVISTVCNTARGGFSGCRKTAPCTRVLS
jgi:hypothetical protein